ncbi:potassium voltage-gated channel subfamily KQT member 2-like [Clytia hemisphaerica]|uniref:Ion transport domain-containing protein n=1 Tax=Clytia hemisphaerica TaxID=252671 RepID=A0A7M5US28_9CNID
MSENIHLDTIIVSKNEAPVIKEKTPYLISADFEEKPEINYNTAKKWVYFLLERPNTRFAVIYHFTSLMLIVGSLVVSVLSTIEEMEDKMISVMFYYELFLLIWFFGEFGLRLWSCSYISRYQGTRGHLRFLFSIYMLIDIFVILSTITTFVMQINGSYFAILRVTRFMQVFRILRIDRQRGDFRTMGNVVKEHSKELITVYFVGFVIMFSATYIVYLVEKHTEPLEKTAADVPDPTPTSSSNETLSEVTINNMANGLYWAVITVTSVGYGDISPITWAGKVFTAVFALIGCAFFSLPAGILGSGFALQVAKQKKEKRYVKVRSPAAYLIQTAWRNYALRKGHKDSEGTWKYLLPMLKDDYETPKEQTLEQMMKSEIAKGNYDMGTMFPPVFSSDGIRSRNGDFIRKTESPRMDKYFVPMLNNNNHNPLEEGIKRLGKIIGRGTDTSAMSQSNIISRDAILIPKSRQSKYQRTESKTSSNHHPHGKNNGASHHNNEMADVKIHQQIRERYKIALRFIMKLRYLTAIKIFKSVRHPFVNMQDIMEKNAVSHVEMLSHIKNMSDSFDVLHDELLELRYSLMEMRDGDGLSSPRQKTIQSPFRYNQPSFRRSMKRSHSFTAGTDLAI